MSNGAVMTPALTPVRAMTTAIEKPMIKPMGDAFWCLRPEQRSFKSWGRLVHVPSRCWYNLLLIHFSRRCTPSSPALAARW